MRKSTPIPVHMYVANHTRVIHDRVSGSARVYAYHGPDEASMRDCGESGCDPSPPVCVTARCQPVPPPYAPLMTDRHATRRPAGPGHTARPVGRLSRVM